MSEIKDLQTFEQKVEASKKEGFSYETEVIPAPSNDELSFEDKVNANSERRGRQERNEIYHPDFNTLKVNDLRHDRNRLNEISEKLFSEGYEPTLDELSFLYGIEKPLPIELQSSEVIEFLSGRNKLEDISRITGFSEQEISLSEEDAFRGGIKYHYGDLNIGEKEFESSSMPEIVQDSVSVRGTDNVFGIKSYDNAHFPKRINGNLFLPFDYKLTKAKNIKFPEIVGEDIVLGSLEKIENVILPRLVGGSLNMGDIKDIENLKLPEYIADTLILRNLRKQKGLVLPKYVGGNVLLERLMEVDSLVFPDKIEDSLVLNSVKKIKDIENFKLPKRLKVKFICLV